MYDYLLVGSGLFCATLARRLTDSGYSCLIMERRDHIGGNVYSERIDGIMVHKYGPHIFHTNDDRIWRWVNRFGNWAQYEHHVKAINNGKVYTLPINLDTIQQVHDYTMITPEQARHFFRGLSTLYGECPPSGSAREWCMKHMGRQIYETLFDGYTRKQWGMDPKDLPSKIVSRIPIRTNYDNNYYNNSKYQAIPEDGYARIVESMLDGIKVQAGIDFLDVARHAWRIIAKDLIYSGPIDALYGHKLGRLQYRRLRFETETLPVPDYQGCAQMNYPNVDVPHTRIIEWKHLDPSKGAKALPHTVITREYPSEVGEPLYPVGTSENHRLAYRYQSMAEQEGILYGGRLGEYVYYDMDQVIGSALKMADALVGERWE